MKQLITFLLLVLNVPVLFAQDAKSYIHQGNELYRQKKYKEAEEAYRKAAAIKGQTQTVESNFNLGDALYKEKKFDSAGRNFSAIASSSTNPLLKAGAYHNLGNSLLTSKQYDKSIEAYKKALLNNPQDDQTRYNLAYAQEMLKKQNNQNKNNQDKNNQDKNKSNQDKSKSDKDKSKQEKDKNKSDQDKNNQDEKNQQGQPPPPDKVSKEDAQRMLDALNDQEKGTQDKLKNKKLRGVKVPVIKDW